MPWNTDNPPTDLERIRRALKVPAEKYYLDIIRISMSRVERESPDTIATIQESLDSLDSNRSDIRAVRANPTYSMSRADVVEWDAATPQDTGLVVDREEIREEIAAALLIQLPERNNGTLGRS